MTEAIPLRTTLRVESVQIVEDVRKGVLQLVLKRFSPVERWVWQFCRETDEFQLALVAEWISRWSLTSSLLFPLTQSALPL